MVLEYIGMALWTTDESGCAGKRTKEINHLGYTVVMDDGSDG